MIIEDNNFHGYGQIPGASINRDWHGSPTGSETEPNSVGIVLTRGDGLRVSGRQAFAAIVGNGAVDNGAAIDAFPCVKHEKEIREPLQHHHSLTLRTFH